METALHRCCSFSNSFLVLPQELAPLVLGEAVRAGDWHTAAASEEHVAALRLLQVLRAAGL